MRWRRCFVPVPRVATLCAAHHCRNWAWNAVTWAADPDLQIIVWTAEAGTASHDGLRLLASWAANPAHAANRAMTDHHGLG